MTPIDLKFLRLSDFKQILTMEHGGADRQTGGGVQNFIARSPR